MPFNESYPAGPIQQFLLQWDVAGALDGVTQAPGLVVESGIVTQRTRAPSNPYVIPVNGPAGLFDIDGSGARAVRADRYLMWLRIQPAVFPVPVEFVVDIVDASGLVPSVSSAITLDVIHTGTFSFPGLFLSNMYLVPHGSIVRVSGLGVPPPGAVHRVSMGARTATTSHGDAELAEASCCLGSS